LRHARDGAGMESGERMALSLRDSVHLVSDPANLDASVDEVFGMMLGVECKRIAKEEFGQLESMTAVIGFGGLLSGACVLRCGAEEALVIASRLTGIDCESLDDTVKDGIGEMCNMLAGTWKSKVPELAAHCGLSVPAVITGRDYELHVQAPEFQLRHTYAFEGTNFEVMIVCDGIQ
jgi:chemotaxis protein CheX